MLMLKAETKLLPVHFLPMTEASPSAQLRRGDSNKGGKNVAGSFSA